MGTLQITMVDLSTLIEGSPVKKSRKIIQGLYEIGTANVKRAIDIVAKQMGISRYTVYNYIRNTRLKGEE